MYYFIMLLLLSSSLFIEADKDIQSSSISSYQVSMSDLTALMDENFIEISYPLVLLFDECGELKETYDKNFETIDFQRFLETRNRVDCDSNSTVFQGLLQLVSEQIVDDSPTVFILTITDKFCSACAELKAEINDWGPKETSRIFNLEAQFK